MSEVLTTPEIKRALKPASKWRNWWRAVNYIRFQSGVEAYPDEVFPSPFVWPSRDVAESKAHVCLTDMRFAAARGDAEYLGAYADGEAP